VFLSPVRGVPPFHVCYPTPRRHCVEHSMRDIRLVKHVLAVTEASRQSGRPRSRLPHVCSFGNKPELFPQDTVSGAVHEMSFHLQGRCDNKMLPSLAGRWPSGRTHVAEFELRRAVDLSRHPVPPSKIRKKIPPCKLTRPLPKSLAACGTCYGWKKKHLTPEFHDARIILVVT
jgi:hypothetical protein